MEFICYNKYFVPTNANVSPPKNDIFSQDLVITTADISA